MDKKTAPTVILILLVIVVLGYAGTLVVLLTREAPGTFWSLLFIVVPLAFIAALIAVYVERIREINKEEKDDLSKY